MKLEYRCSLTYNRLSYDFSEIQYNVKRQKRKKNPVKFELNNAMTSQYLQWRSVMVTGTVMVIRFIEIVLIIENYHQQGYTRRRNGLQI